MAIQNNLANSSIRKYLPSKLISGIVMTIAPLEGWLYDDGMGDPWWQGAGAAPYRWAITVEISPSFHSSHLTRVPFQYTGTDIQTGMWIFADGEPKAVRIRSITAQSDYSIECVVEDVDRYNTFNDLTQSGIGIFAEARKVCFFEVGDDGYPLFDPMPDGFDTFTINQVESRFRKFNSNNEVRFFQINHGFKESQILKLNPVTRQFENATASDLYVVGTVTAVGPGPNNFYLSPSTKFISNLAPGLPGGVGDMIWLDSTTGDRTIVPSGANPVYIKMTRSVASFGVGSVSNPTTYEGTTIKLNTKEIVFAQPGTNTLSQITSEINNHIAQTGVFAGVGAPPTVVSGTESYPSTTPATVLSFLLNNVPVTVAGPSISFGTSGDLGWWDVIRAINELTQNHGVVASSDPFSGGIILTNNSGNAINLTPVTPEFTSGADKNILDMLGVAASNPGATPDRLMLVRSDGGPITITEVTGTFTYDVGLQSVANGVLPIALVVDKTMNTNENYVVADIDARDALTGLRDGDQVFVQQAEDGEWALYLLVDDSWVKLSDADSANTDANTLTATFDYQATSPIVVGTVSNNSRIANVTVVVTEEFDGGATLSVGIPGQPDVIMSSDIIDLSLVGSYEASSTYTYFGVTEGEIQLVLSASAATKGQAQVVISYL